MTSRPPGFGGADRFGNTLVSETSGLRLPRPGRRLVRVRERCGGLWSCGHGQGVEGERVEDGPHGRGVAAPTAGGGHGLSGEGVRIFPVSRAGRI
jgi:hypothetical protein